MLANLFEVVFSRGNLGSAIGLQKRPHFFVQITAEPLQLFLALTALSFQPLPLTFLRQTIAAAAQQLCRTTEEAAVGQDILQRASGFGNAVVFLFDRAEVALLDLILGQ